MIQTNNNTNSIQMASCRQLNRLSNKLIKLKCTKIITIPMLRIVISISKICNSLISITKIGFNTINLTSEINIHQV